MLIPIRKLRWLLLFSLLTAGAGFILFSPDHFSTSTSLAAPLAQNSYSECPPHSGSIWVRVNTNRFGNQDQTLQIPFDSGEVRGDDGNTYVNYLLGVLLTEIGPDVDFTEINEKMMRAMAILARTVAYKNCGCELIANNTNCSLSSFPDANGVYHRGMDDSVKQQYNPRRRSDFSADERAIYQRAIDDTKGVYLTYNNSVFDVQYRDISEEWTGDYGGLPHISIYDPAGRHHDGEGNQPGFPQKNANHYAQGKNHDELLPPYDPLQQLGHYLSAIGFVGLDPDPPNDYRFNVLEFGGMDDQRNNPLRLRRGYIYYYPFILQNTGVNSWPLFCSGDSYGAALSFHWYSYPSNRYLSPQESYFEGSRTLLCPGSDDGSSLAPGKVYPSQELGHSSRFTYLVVDVPSGDYWLRLDVEFPQAGVWGSRLHPQDNPNNARWPTQDIHVQVVEGRPSTPTPGLDSGQIPGRWSNNSSASISWPTADDPIGVSSYKYRWDGGDWQTTSGRSASKTLANGSHDFEVVAVAQDGVESSEALIDDILIDATPPTAVLTPLPIRVQAFTYLISWASGDTGGSELTENRFEYRLWRGDQLLVDWSRVDAVNNPAQTSILFDFPGGQHGDRYEFRLSVRDGADNWSNLSYTSTTFNPDPELHVRPPQLIWFSVYSNTLPKVEYLTIENYGGDTLNWTATTPFTLATLGQTEGTAPPITTIPVTLTHPVNITTTYQGSVFVNSSTPGVHNASQVIPVTIYVLDNDNTQYLPVIFKQ